MKELKEEIIQLPAIGRQTNWTDLFNVLFPKVSGISLDDFIKLEITAGTLKITRMVNNERSN